MKFVDIENVEPGQVLGRTIFSSNGTILLSSGVQLTVFMISTLKRLGVTTVYLEDPAFRDIPQEEVLSDETKRVVISLMAQTFESLRSGKSFNSKAVSQSVDMILEDVLRNQNVLVHLSDIRTADNRAYMHAMNVCALSSLLGLNMGLNMLQLKELAVGALLHDIGKLNKIEEEEVGRMHHAWRGFELFKMKREYSLLSAHVAFQHHEHVDGTGKPRGLSGDSIHLYAKITAVANMYDNLIFGKDDAPPLQPHEACEQLNAMADKELDHEVLVQFMRIISVYPNGISVRLSNRQVGVVAGQHRGLPGRPIVRVIDKVGDEVIDAEVVDLSQRTTIFIDEVMV
jgi:HD-GYP domain-containing protein (c-di-GMP phosphodiesterase class II)